MAIDRAKIKDFLVFKGEFAVNFCRGVNVLIGANATGKTTLMKALYAVCNISSSTIIREEILEIHSPFIVKGYFTQILKHIEAEKGLNAVLSVYDNSISKEPVVNILLDSNLESESISIQASSSTMLKKWMEKDIKSVFIPEKDLLSNSRGLPETYEYGNAQYTQCEIDVVKKARVLANRPEQPLYREICDLIGGEPENDGQNFFIKRRGLEKRIPFSMEASGYRKFGLLATLIRN
ncbi:MAG: AAA family ATPase [Synergistaceae bacterium]|jgi:hypothetical protein|nr:AAA family ATPase [Synergistaceae bacterium]